MVESAEDGAGADWTVPRPVRCLRRLELERPVRAGDVVESGELRQHRPQVPFVDDDQVVEALSA
jgi:hypothetical protein